MGAPKLPSEVEEERKAVVDQLDEKALRKDGALRHVAEAVQVICDVPIAHVSLMEEDHQCIVGHVGLEMARYDRDETFCAYTFAEQEVVIVEDATEDPRFEDNPFVEEDPGISFYVGLPLIVDDAPVGTLCAIDTEPNTLRLDQRGEIFGLVSTLERHLKAIYLHEPWTPQHGISSKLTAMQVLSLKERFRHGGENTLSKSLLDLEAEGKEAFEMLVDMPTVDEARLGMASTAVEWEDEN